MDQYQSGSGLDEQLAILRIQMPNTTPHLQEITKLSSYIRGVGENLNVDRGNECAGIFSVTTERGTGALKIHTRNVIHYGHSVLMQKALGHVGKSPEVYGYIPEQEMEKIITQHGVQLERRLGTASFGVIMAEVDGAWSYMRGHARRPDYFASLNLDSLVDQIRAIQDAVNGLRIIPGNAQFMISRDGQVYIFDLDKAMWISEENELYGFAASLEMEEHGAELRAATKPLPMQNDFSEEIECLRKLFS